MALLIGAILLGGRLLGVFGQGPVPIELHYMLGDAPVTELEARLHKPGREDTLATFSTRVITGDVKHETRVPAGDLVVEITWTGKDGGRTSVKRTIRAERGAVIRLNLAPEAARP